MIVYSFNNAGELVGELVADENPLKKGDYLIPKNCTKIKPPLFSDNEVAVFNGVEWVVNLIEVEKVDEKKIRESEILARFSEIDSLSIRPLRAVAAGTASEFDTNKLAELEAERETLAAELVVLNG